MKPFKKSFKRGKTDVSFFADIDNFKTINDTYGHDKGDKVYKRLAGAFKQVFEEVM